jgi:hypothetical protein
MLDSLAGKKPEYPPCKDEGTGSWFGTWARTHITDSTFDVTTSWRECFQAILAGDFLSPDLIGVFYRDNFPVPNPFTGNAFWADRAQLLEKSFEARHHRMTLGGRSVTCPDFSGNEVVKVGEETGLCRRFGYHPAVTPGAEGWKEWVPLLFFNSTSVVTGRRIIVSDVPIGQPYLEKPGKTLMPFAYDLWQLRADDSNTLPDIRLSTAATLSARFPVISPYGGIRDGSDQKLIDQAVDGGYFENNGLATSADVAEALKDYHLGPVVVSIVNEPAPIEAPKPLGKDRPARPVDDGRTPFDGIASIFRALTATRSGHEDDYDSYLQDVLGQGEERIYRINVEKLSPDKLTSSTSRRGSIESRIASSLCRRRVADSGYMEFVSMSWWMSQPVQVYLDAQLCTSANVDRLACELVQGARTDGSLCKLSNEFAAPH